MTSDERNETLTIDEWHGVFHADWQLRRDVADSTLTILNQPADADRAAERREWAHVVGN